MPEPFNEEEIQGASDKPPAAVKKFTKMSIDDILQEGGGVMSWRLMERDE